MDTQLQGTQPNSCNKEKEDIIGYFIRRQSEGVAEINNEIKKAFEFDETRPDTDEDKKSASAQ